MKLIYKTIDELVVRIDERNMNNEDIPLVGLSIDKCFISSVANTIGTDLSKYKRIYKKDFAVSLMQVSRDSRIPIACLKEYDVAILSPAYSIFRVKDEKVILPEYLEMWFMRREFDREAAFIAVGGVRGSMPWTEFAMMKVAVPDIKKQKSIVKAYKAVNDRIALKKQINDSLLASAQAIYQTMFIETAPKYPQKPLKNICSKIGSGATPKGGKTTYKDFGISLIRSTNVFDYEFSYNALAHVTDEQAAQLSNVIVEPWDVLFNITGASVTRCCVVPNDILPARVNQHVMIIRPILGKGMSYYIMMTLCNIMNKTKLMGIAQSGSTREAINKHEIEEFLIPVPPEERILDFEQKVTVFFSTIADNTREIQQMRVMQQLLLSQLAN